MNDNEIQMGDKLNVSALQLIYLCDSAIEKFCDKLPDTDGGEYDGLETIMNFPSSIQCAKEAVIEFFEDNKDEIIKEE